MIKPCAQTKLAGSSGLTSQQPMPAQLFKSLMPSETGEATLLNCIAHVQEVLEWLAKPENLQQADNLPPFIEGLDVGAYVATALPIAGFVLGVNVLDEVVQRGVALQKKVPACQESRISDPTQHSHPMTCRVTYITLRQLRSHVTGGWTALPANSYSMPSQQ